MPRRRVSCCSSCRSWRRSSWRPRSASSSASPARGCTAPTWRASPSPSSSPCRRIASTFGELFGGDAGFYISVERRPEWLSTIIANEQWQAWVGLIVAAVVLGVLAQLVRSPSAIRMQAVRDDEPAARLSGIDPVAVRVGMFGISAAAAGLGGGVLAYVTQAVSPGAYSLTFSLFLLVAVVIGGVGTLPGAIWGAIVIVLVPEITTAITEALPLSAELSQRLDGNLAIVVFGVILVVVMLAAPRGIHGAVAALTGRLRRRPGNARTHHRTTHLMITKGTTMTQPHARATTVSAIALAVAGALVLSSCSTPQAEAQPGLTDDTITIGTHQPLTGPAAASYAPISAATAAYFDYVNAEGGINGRTIEYIVKDDGYNPANTQTVVRELVLEDEVFAILGGLGTPTHSSVLDFLNENEVPDLFVSSGSAAWNQAEKYPFTFGFQADYVTEGMVLGQYISEEFDGKKVCLFGQDDEFGTDMQEGLGKILGDDGLAEVQTYSVSNQDVTAQIVALQAAGCEVNVLATITGFTALAIGTAAQLKYFPQWVSSSSGADYGPLVRLPRRRRAAAARRVRERQLPAVGHRRGQQVDRALPADQRRVQRRRRVHRLRRLRHGDGLPVRRGPARRRRAADPRGARRRGAVG